MVSSRDPGHNHTGNVSIARARKAVGEMKNKIMDLTMAPSSLQAAVTSQLPDRHSDGPAKASDSVVVLAYEAEGITIEKHRLQLNCGINTQLDWMA